MKIAVNAVKMHAHISDDSRIDEGLCSIKHMPGENLIGCITDTKSKKT